LIVGSLDAVLTTNTISMAATGSFRSDWEPLPALARDVILFKPYGLGGDGSEDPVLYAVIAYFRR
jgi:hypothetical protein